MNKWDKVEKSKRIATEQDVQWEYFKMVLWILFGIGYFYFGVLGMTI